MSTTWQDRRYDNRDRVMADDGNYETTGGGADAMFREMSCHETEVDGEIYGNRAHVRHSRPQASDLRGIIRDYQDVADRHMALGRVADVTVELWEEKVGTVDGVPLLVQGTDVIAQMRIRDQMIYKEGT